jgi:Haem-binding domain
MTIDDPTSTPLDAPGPSPRRFPFGRRKADGGTGLARMTGYTGLACVAMFALIQLVPYGHSHTNPPVTGEPAWATPRTRELAVRACYDCHSNETVWPWYSSVAPVSWLVTQHTDEGRRALNFSEFTSNPGRGAGEAAEKVSDGEMPPNYFTWFGLHSAANLTDAEKAELVAGLQATPGFSEKVRGGGQTSAGNDNNRD